MHAQRTRIEPMQYHEPGWISEPEGENHYWVWAPNEDRDHWAASWQSPLDPDDPDDMGHGDYRRGDSLDAVLGVFPDDIASAFREAIDVTSTGNQGGTT